MLTQSVAGRVYDYSHCVGTNAQRGRGFSFPVATAIGEGDLVYVLNRSSESVVNVHWSRTGEGARVSMVNMGDVRDDAEHLGEFSRNGVNDGQLIWPTGMDMDHQRNLYITDEWLDQVSIFDKDGNFLSKWSVAQDGDAGPYGAAGIALDPDENVYVAGGRSHQIRKFTKDGQLITTWGSLGDGPGQLNSPWGLTVDDQGFVYVADSLNHRAQKFTSGGEYVAQFGAPHSDHSNLKQFENRGTGRGEMSYPNDVTVDPAGDVYVCDWSDNGINPGRVHIFAPDGEFITSLVGDAEELSSWAQETVDANADVIKARRRVHTREPEWRFAMPAGVHFDPIKSRILVSDCQRARVQIYDKVLDFLPAQMNL